MAEEFSFFSFSSDGRRKRRKEGRSRRIPGDTSKTEKKRRGKGQKELLLSPPPLLFLKGRGRRERERAFCCLGDRSPFSSVCQFPLAKSSDSKIRKIQTDGHEMETKRAFPNDERPSFLPWYPRRFLTLGLFRQRIPQRRKKEASKRGRRRSRRAGRKGLVDIFRPA